MRKNVTTSIEEKYTIAKKFYDSFDKKLINDLVYQNPRIFSSIEFVIQNIDSKDLKILDLGCGLGYSSFEIARNNNNSVVTGLDLSAQLINVAKRLFNKENLIFDNGNIVESIETANKYNVIVLIDVLEHISLEDRGRFLSNISNILDDQWKIIITAPSYLHQEYLKSHKPSGLQPVDEILLFSDYECIAKDLHGTIKHFGYESIWYTNDYCYCVITGDLDYKPKTRKSFGLLNRYKLLYLLWRKGFISTKRLIKVSLRKTRKI